MNTLAQTELSLTKANLKINSLQHRLAVIKAINVSKLDPQVKQAIVNAALIVDDTVTFADGLNTKFGIKI